jgi:hypothetical protein
MVFEEVERRYLTVEESALRAYHRRFGKDAPIPSQFVDHYELNGKHYIALTNVNGILAVYRVRNQCVSPKLHFIDVAWFESHVQAKIERRT